MTPPNDPTVRAVDIDPSELTRAVRSMAMPAFNPDRMLNHLRAISQILRKLPEQPSEPSLVYTDAAGSIRSHPVGQDLKVGRQVSKGLELPLEKTLSRLHFQIIRDGDVFLLRNQSKSNGTTIEGESQTITEWELRDGDVIHAGRLSFVFVLGTTT